MNYNVPPTWVEVTKDTFDATMSTINYRSTAFEHVIVYEDLYDLQKIGGISDKHIPHTYYLVSCFCGGSFGGSH